MKPYQLAELLNITPATIRRWAREEYTEFLSPDAQGGNRLHRSFSDHDARVIAWIAQMRAQNMLPANITLALKGAEADNWRHLPQLPGSAPSDESVALMPVEAAKARIDALQERLQAVARERDDLQARLTRTETENVDLHQQLKTITEQVLDLNRRLTSMLEKEQKRRK